MSEMKVHAIVVGIALLLVAICFGGAYHIFHVQEAWKDSDVVLMRYAHIAVVAGVVAMAMAVVDATFGWGRFDKKDVP